MSTPFPTGTILGYPRIGPRRELKKMVEAFWAGQIDADELAQRSAELRAATRRRLAHLGLGTTDSSIPEHFSYYDHVLDAALMVGAVPERFRDLADDAGAVSPAGMFTIARGEGERAPLEMTKWFDTNYHYLVPEIGPETVFRFTGSDLIDQFIESTTSGYLTRPVVVGPVTLLLLSKATESAPADFVPLDRLDDVLPAYRELLTHLADAGAEWVQLDEPALVNESISVPRSEQLAALERATTVLGEWSPRPSLFVAAPYGALGDALDVLAASPVEAIGLDLARGEFPADLGAETRARLARKTLVAGVVDGRNIWRGDLEASLATATSLRTLSDDIAVSTSTSLIHVPHSIDDESRIDPRLKNWLAFADQKVEQVAVLARALETGPESVRTELDSATAALQDRLTAPGVRVPAVRERVAGLTSDDFTRSEYTDRVEAQAAWLDLPVLPTTTVGSFPQTAEIRRARARFGRGELSQGEYQKVMREEIARVVNLQEDLGLDVIVHGEPERNDMVQYFAEHLDGFEVTDNGWVQSYGSRCTRPSILWGDVSRPAPITVEWSRYAQSLTDRPVKGMLTGPVTILAWSFVRDDQPLGETALQVALALRDEVDDLQDAGIRIIQVDEPALRELLPLKRRDHAAYLDWSVRAFRLATGGAHEKTQVHTHLCYSEFGVVIDAIRNLDADVTSIEAARSRMDVVDDLKASGFDHGIGPGVYDIHSPRVPSVEEVRALLERAVAAIPERQLWVNPDCGLKTRGYEETVESLRNIIAATGQVRASVRSRG